MNATPPPVHALSFDIEDWFHLVEIDAVRDPADWPRLSDESSIVERYTDLILRVCAEHETRATFFVLGWVAERHPALIRRISEAGHEIGTHSYWHRKIYDLTAAAFAADLRESLDAIRAAIGPGIAIRGFRAPSFSITPGAEWAFDALLDAGLTYDSSLFPAPRGHGGYPCPRGPHTITAPSGRTLRELPISVASLGGARACYSGGGYLRLLPLSLIRHGIRRESAAGRPTVVYLHPRDFASDAPRVPMPLVRRFKCTVGLDSTERKLRALLREYRWGTCEEVLSSPTYRDSSGPVPTESARNSARYAP